MVKVKNKKRNTAESVNDKKASKNKKVLNPFEVHINKEKIRVLGKKAKNDRGLPGVSRAKALQKRKNTILPEYKVQNKSNQFTDKRIGEKNRSLSADEKSIARYTAVRMNQHKKKSIYNLADDEVLTHKGQTLSEIEKFEDVPHSDDDDDEVDGQRNSGRLDSSFVEDAHFGGGMLKKADGAKSHKDLIEQLIMESKKRKAEMQKQKMANSDLTDKLDSEWKDLLPIVTNSNKKEEELAAAKVDDYDKVMRELKFEARGTPSDKLKTEDDIAKEEKDKLERLERERLERMKGNVFDAASTKIVHRSADDLDDNFAYDSDTPDVTLSYNDGKSNVPMEDEDKEEENENEDVEEEVEEEELETESEDDMSDLKEDEESSSEDEDIPIVEAKVLSKKESATKLINGKHKLDEPEEDETKRSKLDIKDPEKIKEDLMFRKEMMEEARKELPYTFALPENYEQLQELLKDKPSHHQSVIIERMIKCNHPSLKEGNKDELGHLFAYLLQHLSDICCDIEDCKDVKHCFDVFACMTPQFFDLAQLNPETSHRSLIEVFKEKQAEYRKKPTKFPTVEVLLYLKLGSCLFSTSDFRHLVVTPSLVFMEQMLTWCKAKTRANVAYGLFLVSLIAEYTTLSKRYSPASIKFLCGILHMAIPKVTVRQIKVLPPFKHISSSLVLAEQVETFDNPKLDVTDLIDVKDFDDAFRIKAINVSLGLLKYFHSNCQPLSSCPEIFETAFNYLSQLPKENYPESLSKSLNSFLETLDEGKNNRTLEYVVMEKKKPKALRLYEPNIVKIFDRKMHKSQSKEKAERDKLLHKIKKEKKGAIREIRRDKAFLGRVKINQKIQSDTVRKEKVKKIYAEAASQQCALNAMDRYNEVRSKKR
ncbi:PREDICTED: nucleolar protein 14 homolog [Nicrophorus vespilloides]|uniref:Nucleolar protein 14 homolog n=1 Tax=Nicrophorus vespilloides TaxID=110193 RepID=A0ABM1MZQ2_NICVS|nr:PREDICTED: nucleolar protein 14 homolog [Nicrophorus vespilloides]